MTFLRVCILTACTSGLIHALPITVTGNYVRATFTDRGVLSNLLYDPSGTQNFGINDYIAPGNPFEAFGVRTAGTGLVSNSNSAAGQPIAGSITGSSGGSSGGSVTWMGATSDFLITHVFSFGNLDRRVNISTTFTAQTALTNVRLSRAVDPDPDNYPGGSASTMNQRGSTSPALPVTDFVGSVGLISGRPLGLLYTGSLTHDTGIVGSCCTIVDPDTYLAGGTLGNSSSGDHGIGIGFALGDMAAGSSVTWNYAYVMGDSVSTIDTGSEMPEPATNALIAVGLFAIGLRHRSRR